MSLKNKINISLLLLLLCAKLAVSQDKHYKYDIDVNYATGRLIAHKKDAISYFKGNKGLSSYTFISLNKYTFGHKEWERLHHFPAYGIVFSYQKNNAAFLGDVYSIMLHYTYYLYKRKLSIKIADGLAFATNPYHKETNRDNTFLTSTLLNGFLFSIQYKEPNIWHRFGFQVGTLFSHYSNGATKLKNNGLNTWFVQVGLNYSLGERNNEFIYNGTSNPVDKKIHYNLVYRNGFNQNLSETKHTYLFTISLFADKRLNKKGAIQIGADYFSSDFLKAWLQQYYPHKKPNSKRIGVFIGYELLLNKASFPIQFGYYVYNPFKYKSKFYQRLGSKYFVNKHIFLSLALKTHLSTAEAIEFGLGVRL